MRARPLLLTLLLAVLLLPSAAVAANPDLPSGPRWYEDPRVGAEWTEEYITEADGTVLHADVLRPKGLPRDARTPVILTIGPYFAHAGGFGLTGALDGDPALPVGKQAGPSDVWTDLFVHGRLMQRGYTFAFVDTRGTGGSTGCLDFAGPGEQADVVEAVRWAANAPWSTGSVGIYGKSYLGVTGLVGAVKEPPGLKAVVSMEPVYDQYEYLYANGVRFPQLARHAAALLRHRRDPGHRHERLPAVPAQRAERPRATGLPGPRLPRAGGQQRQEHAVLAGPRPRAAGRRARARPTVPHAGVPRGQHQAGGQRLAVLQRAGRPRAPCLVRAVRPHPRR
ncbi:CocE/NonD family hydrolase [Conexibacter sp. W3-3-2]|uniref:CocE/NonD family hydrolase n=1 Tax=Conexibacter sp. W3-3-2 TaxID=2675227 RepID=UPI0012B81775|nr:CocE/NonD family hydrolase [Conexibacter sp. W3-3-2]MTD45349.1 CocE/NonD family hydrolase [Conexibacter sp. W3-3-2]